MTKILSITLLLVMLILQTPVCQLSKLSVLVEHYFEHKHVDGDDIAMLDYLAIYCLGDVKRVDCEKDIQLSFKHSCPSFFMIAYGTPGPIESPLPKPRLTKLDYASNHRSFHTTESFVNVWQPPRGLLYA